MKPTHLQNIRQHGQIHGIRQDQMMTGGLQIGLGQIGCPVRDSCRQKAQMITRSGSRRAGPEVSDFGGLRRGCRCIVSRRSSRTFRHDWIRRWSCRRREVVARIESREYPTDSSEKVLSSLYFSSLGFFKSKGKRSYWSFGVLMCSWRVKRTTLDVYLLACAAFRRIVCTTKPVRTTHSRWAKAIEPGKRFYIRLRYGMLGVLHCMYMDKNIHMYSTYILLRITRQPTHRPIFGGIFRSLRRTSTRSHGAAGQRLLLRYC